MLLIPAQHVLHYLHGLARNSRRALVERVLLTNFVEDSHGARTYALGLDSFDLGCALAQEELELYGYLVCEYRCQGRPRLQAAYGRTVGAFSQTDWWLMRRTVSVSLQQATLESQLDSGPVLFPQPARAAFLLGSHRQTARAVYVFHRNLSQLEGLTLLDRALEGRRHGLPACDLLPDETAH